MVNSRRKPTSIGPLLRHDLAGRLALLGTQAVEVDDDDDQGAGDNSLPEGIYVKQICV
jgi:hypothetical protein